ncbi:Carboxypeptidase regulatory-like domain-containing protein [Pseudarcicella hirudinis]|uniref:Carboxypeptidase regulatory-like domain-containing protein n=2 Tax=Pseudarcicella hirudinis TaxID=1079859 RepID=A0A1I5PG66_9BACT|nr:carboxypeptidase regulatory-like domain-containing protein [Pseudarcicella hirudinis]SFP33059.1 Carboxypeptidase regulatory-like domain-containing protein [Pseudarcicella hirudinis]
MLKQIFTNKVVLGIFFALFMTLSNVQIFAQGTTTAALSGVVVDEKGDVLPGATIIAIHEPTGTRYGASTRSNGQFNIVNMRVGGPYKVTASFVGFQENVKTGIVLTLSQELRMNFKLETAQTQLEEVKVVAARSSVINSGRTGAATTVGNSQIRTLPTYNRSLGDFARLDPRANGLSFAGRNNLYNNIAVDGASFNNTFGLNGTIGGQASASPISIDAIDQFIVNIAPYDVRQGLSTGANINIVTKSGTNELSGSAYYFGKNQDLVGKKVGSVESPIGNFSTGQFGGRLGGAIVKNKLFFFVSYEQEKRTDPGSNFVANRPGVTAAPGAGSNTSAVLASDLDKLRAFLIEKYKYDPGAYENYDKLTYSQKVNIRLDWNISDKHKLNFKYNNLRSYADISPSNSGALANGRNPSNTNLPFQASLYRINNNMDSYIAELNSTFNSSVSNNFTVNYTQMRDFRESPANNTPFPTVDIGNGSGQSAASFGYEPFTANNKLDSDILQIADNLTIYKGKHVFTIGAAYENNSFVNGFAPNYYGGYQFKSFDDFYASANNGTSNALVYRQQYSNFAYFPFAEMKGTMYSLYAQDEITLKSGFKLTLGLRGDGVTFPIDNSDLRYTNKYVPALTFNDNGQPVKLATDRFPGFTTLFSPRVGFNWDVKDDKQTQIRGGAGIFSGRIPYVWLSNQLSNNGVLFGSESITNPTNRPFNPNPDAFRPPVDPANVKPTSYNLAVTDQNFKFPQIFRANLAIDKQLGNGWLATAEALYTKDLNAVYLANVNLPNPISAIGGDTRPIYYNVGANGFPSTTNNRIYGSIPAAQGGNTVDKPNISDAILMKNTNNGYSYALTATLAKTFESGLFASLSYTYTDARSVNDGGSIAQSMWRDRAVSGSPNSDATSYTNFLQSNRINAFGSYKFNYSKLASTTLGFSYSVAPAGRFSYVYSGDMNGDGAGGNNDLIYIPKDQSDILLRDIKNSAGVVTYSAAQQWTALDNFIKQDSYLNSRRGQYAERNGAELPWAASFDFKVIQDFYIKTGGKTNTLQLTIDVFNAGNYITSNWGLSQSPVRSALINFIGYDNTGATATGKPVFQFPQQNGGDLTDSFQKNFGASNRWQLQFGVRYIFN